TTLSRQFLCFGNHDVPTLRPRHAAFHHQQILVLIYPDHAQIAGRDLLVSHVSRHPHAFEYTRRKRRRSDRTSNLEHRTVRLRTTAKVMPLHHTLKASSLADSHDVDKLFAIEDLDQHAIPDLHRSIAIRGRFYFERNLAHEFHRRQIVLRQMSLRGFREPRLFHKLNQPDLRRLVSILHSRFVLRHHARASLQYCDRADVAPRVKQLRHPDLLAQNSRDLRCHFLLHAQRALSLLSREVICSCH